MFLPHVQPGNSCLEVSSLIVPESVDRGTRQVLQTGGNECDFFFKSGFLEISSG